MSCTQQKNNLLDDSSDPDYQARVDVFANRFPERVAVVRRPDRKAFKAGNMNHGLSVAATEEPYFAIADAEVFRKAGLNLR